ncbi:Hypothetical protein CINCED_3A021146 [Cinara cedri]|uniref:Uncharacterized protein n=1 Tax=Cinara cedri TaxID=506608 RepID=A0A5E4NR20_9HEMI|nr:Hypothetical protein CINCED_3A021146 [Cinara cedri]
MAFKISKLIEHEKYVEKFYNINFISKHSYEVRDYSTITAFEDSLSLILDQFSKYYLSVFPTETKVNDLCKRLETNPSNEYDLRIRKDYVVNICLHIVRCIDYLYVSGLYRNKKLFNLYKSHSLLCRTIQQFFTEHCKQSKVTDDEMTISCNVKKLHIVLREIIYFEQITEEESLKYQENTVYQSNATKFVKLEFELMSDIDWTETFFNDSAQYNIFKQTPTQNVERLNHQTLCDTINLEKSFKKHSQKYSKDIKTNKCAPLLLTKFRSTYDEVKNLILYSLQRLEEYFTFMLQSSNNTMYQLNEDQINQNVLSPFKKLCGDVPEILLYIHDHQTNDPIELTLFNLFLSLCGNHMDFIDLRCPAKHESVFNSVLLYQEKCIREAIRVKLLWNFYVRNDKILEVDQFTTNSTINNDCSELNYKYIKDISTSITEFYTKKGNEVIIWTTLPVKCEPKVNILKIITAIKKLKDDSNFSEIRNNIPSTTYEEQYSAIKTKVVLKNMIDYFNSYLKRNCFAAIDFVGKFVDIVRKSTKVINPSNSHYDSNIDELPCHDLNSS